jgi:hypothetical protein
MSEAEEAIEGRGTCMILPVLPVELVAELDLAIMEPHSMTRFLTLPTVTTRINLTKRDPIVNFAKINHFYVKPVCRSYALNEN